MKFSDLHLNDGTHLRELELLQDRIDELRNVLDSVERDIQDALDLKNHDNIDQFLNNAESVESDGFVVLSHEWFDLKQEVKQYVDELSKDYVFHKLSK